MSDTPEARKHLLRRRILALLGFVFCLMAPTLAFGSDRWELIAPGLEIAFFKANWVTPVGDSTITVLRADPGNWDLRIVCASETEEQSALTAREWCGQHGLVAATNAGMFATDRKTHVGYLRSRDHVNNPSVNIYQSALAAYPIDPDQMRVRIFDLDVTHLDDILNQYSSVAQNLRLIKRPGTNRWSQQAKMWSEAALGQDAHGRILFIFARSPFTMHDLNHILLSLPLELVCAQHLEGGPEAQLYLQHGEVEYEFVGSYETGFHESDSNHRAWKIPNVLGLQARTQRRD